jgi:hypothetical protein
MKAVWVLRTESNGYWRGTYDVFETKAEAYERIQTYLHAWPDADIVGTVTQELVAS